MRNLLFFFVLLIPSMSWAQKDCKETPADLSSKSAIQVDTIITINPNTYARDKKIIHLYHMGEVPILEQKKEGNRTYFYIKKDDCLVIRHVEEIVSRN